MAGAVFPPCSLPRAKHGGGNEDNGDLLQKVPWKHCYTRAPSPAAGQHWPTPPLETPGHSQASLGPSLLGSLLVSPGSWRTQDSVCALQGSISQSREFWQRCGGVHGDLLQEGLLHAQVCCTQSPCPAAVHCWPVSPQEMLQHSSTLERSK